MVDMFVKNFLSVLDNHSPGSDDLSGVVNVIIAGEDLKAVLTSSNETRGSVLCRYDAYLSDHIDLIKQIADFGFETDLEVNLSELEEFVSTGNEEDDEAESECIFHRIREVFLVASVCVRLGITQQEKLNALAKQAQEKIHSLVSVFKNNPNLFRVLKENASVMNSLFPADNSCGKIDGWIEVLIDAQ
jgi:hypothetical protein